MPAAPVREPAGRTAGAEGRAAGAGWAGTTTGVVCSDVPWQELPMPRSPGASATTVRAAIAGTGEMVRGAAREAVP